jgi:hypothetical protein
MDGYNAIATSSTAAFHLPHNQDAPLERLCDGHN